MIYLRHQWYRYRAQQTDGDMTIILWRCWVDHCDAVKTSVMQGRWTLNDLQGPLTDQPARGR